MTELMVPKHVAALRRFEQRRAEAETHSASKALQQQDEILAHELVTIYNVDRPLPRVVPSKVHPYRLYVMLVGIKATAGSIILPPEHIEAQYYNHCLGRIVAMGACCYRGAKWEDIGFTPGMGPQVGDYLTFNPRAPVRETWDGTVLLIMNDDDWRSSPSREEINHLKAGSLL